MSEGGSEGHALAHYYWHPGDRAWRARCTCGWTSGPYDSNEEALSAFRNHRMDVLGWTVVRPHPKGR